MLIQMKTLGVLHGTLLYVFAMIYIPIDDIDENNFGSLLKK